MTVVAFNQLTPAQAERLYLLAEEAGEVVQAAMKILRHGYGSYNPDDPSHPGNRDELAVEIGQFHDVVSLMMDRGDLGDIPLHGAGGRLKYVHHQHEDSSVPEEDHLPFTEGKADPDWQWDVEQRTYVRVDAAPTSGGE